MSSSSASSDHAVVKSRKTKAVTPEKDSLKRKKMSKFSDQSYDEYADFLVDLSKNRSSKSLNIIDSKLIHLQ